MKVAEMLTHSKVLVVSTMSIDDYKTIRGIIHSFKALRFYEVCSIHEFTKNHGDTVANSNIMYSHIGQDVRSSKFSSVMNNTGYILTFDHPYSEYEIKYEILTENACAITF